MPAALLQNTRDSIFLLILLLLVVLEYDIIFCHNAIDPTV
jgi:hypothetical protein